MAARQVVYFGLGFLLAGAKLFGLIAPLGISAIVGVPSGGLVATTAGSMLGYLSMGVTADNLRYIAACIIAASISWLGLFRRNASYYPYVASLIAAVPAEYGGEGRRGLRRHSRACVQIGLVDVLHAVVAGG